MWTVIIAVACGVFLPSGWQIAIPAINPCSPCAVPAFSGQRALVGVGGLRRCRGGLAAYGLVGFFAPPPDANQIRAEATLAPQGPSHLLVPAIHLDEQIVAIPLTAAGWDISRLAFHVGWLESTGVKPNDRTAMAFIGHVTISAAQNGPLPNCKILKLLMRSFIAPAAPIMCMPSIASNTSSPKMSPASTNPRRPPPPRYLHRLELSNRSLRRPPPRRCRPRQTSPVPLNRA